MKGLFSSALGGIAKRLPQWLVPSKVAIKTLQPADIPGISLTPPVSNLSMSEISQLKIINVAELKVDQLEQLAAVFYKGIDGHISRDMKKAVEYWTAAGHKGSLDSIYYRALSIRKGDGVEKDTASAFQELMKLASEHDHARSHVRLSFYCSDLSFSIVCSWCDVPKW